MFVAARVAVVWPPLIICKFLNEVINTLGLQKITAIHGRAEDFAKQKEYQISKINEHKYLLEKEDEKILDKKYYYEDEDFSYDITLIVRKEKLNETEIKEVVSEFDRMNKSAKIRKMK